jgi:phosphatidylserine/phosphatidylglycerophosphate/cardiolipin synthase-like enzyme
MFAAAETGRRLNYQHLPFSYRLWVWAARFSTPLMTRWSAPGWHGQPILIWQEVFVVIRAPIVCAALVVLGATVLVARPAAAVDRLCDPAFENCRTPLLDLINKETQGIDVAFWFMEDARYLTAIVARWKAGVPVRLIVDPRANASYPLNAYMLQGFQDAGIPMRMRVASGILHWKLMLFAGQGVVEFSGANYSDHAFKPVSAYADYVDEAIYFTSDPAIVQTFMTKYDSSWVDTSSFRNYANVNAPLARRYPVFAQAPELNFPPGQSYAMRAGALYGLEPAGIDVIMFRITDRRHSDALLAARARGVAVRLITEMKEYRMVSRLWHAWNVDRIWAAGIPVRVPAHAGMNHQKSVILYGQRTAIFGSSNWTSPSDASQQEHNYFSVAKFWIFDWFVRQFERKWNNSNPLGIAETKPFVPLPPDTPKYVAPGYAAALTSLTPRLTWYGGPWAHVYDIYFGRSATPPLYLSNRNLGPSLTAGQNQGYTMPALSPNTTYYWRIVSKTAAGKTKSGPLWSFTTGS